MTEVSARHKAQVHCGARGLDIKPMIGTQRTFWRLCKRHTQNSQNTEIINFSRQFDSFALIIS